MFLYKYTSHDNALLTLRNLTFYCSNIDAFNDPFEGKFIYPPKIDSIARQIAITLSINSPMIVNNIELCKILDSASQKKEIKIMRELRDLISKHYNNNTITNRETYYQVESEILDFLQKKHFMKHMGKSFVNDLPDQIVNSFIKTTVRMLGILCLSKIKNHPLMWSHYAGNHSGLMFEIDSNKPLFIDNVKNFAMNVEYVDNIPSLSKEAILGLNKKLFEEENNELLKIHLATKSEHWRYEEEVRYMVEKSDPKNNIQRINPEAIKGIYIGLKTPEDSKAEILSIAKKNFPSTFIFETHLRKNSYELESIKLLLK